MNVNIVMGEPDNVMHAGCSAVHVWYTVIVYLECLMLMYDLESYLKMCELR